ncbi:MATH domain and coiled-coil domain-containing protein At3g58270-like isoform X2 [Hibiscus syriacus]|uniref:MATH domain and coiled-coil domain-containing protein At3g58270-like isoform X2 n=1 Tax=Hibiscus syriacus TaxID=106335 RepID=UPI001923A406|nr:MATH domain and coiled-coil domain-containing protein At3g58270-like isoform X2 [Hibiscus syriacus]
MEVNNKCGSNLPKVIWKVEILKVVDVTKSQSEDVNGQVTKVTWRIENFSRIKDKKLYSENFIVDGNKWRILIFPKGNNVNHLSIYLDVADSENLPYGWSRFAGFRFAVIDQIDRTTSIAKDTTHEFKATESDWGFTSFLPLSELKDPKRGYLVDDACLVEAYVSTDISYVLMVQTDSDKHKTEEADCVKAAVDDQKTVSTEPIEITTPAQTQPSCQIVAIEPEDPTEEDIKTFFTSLESELSNSDTVFSKEEAKEALAKLDEALSMTPVDFYDSGKFSSLKQAFKILASFDCSSTTLSAEQKNELLAMEENLKDQVDRAVKAVQDKSRFTEKESIKLTISRNLDLNLIRYKEVESELKQVEQKLAALLAERKGIFQGSKEMKKELEALGKEWAEYEGNAKAAEEEERSVEAEWGRMKDFISSIKGKI